MNHQNLHRVLGDPIHLCPNCSAELINERLEAYCENCLVAWSNIIGTGPRFIVDSARSCGAKCTCVTGEHAADLQTMKDSNPGAAVYLRHSWCPLPYDHEGPHATLCDIVIEEDIRIEQ